MNHNDILFESAKKLIPGGVNSPVRAFGSVGGEPPFIKRGKGAVIWDEDNNQYIDYVGSWGPLVLGHADEDVIDALQKALVDGISFGAPTEKEVLFAQCLVDSVPGLEQVRLTSSGTEAVMSAVRLARGFTQRNLIVKFEGCYHGHVDSLLVKAGSGLLTFDDVIGEASSAGVPESFSKTTLVLPYNRPDLVELLFCKHPNQIAAAIVEPIAGNMNMVVPDVDFLRTLREQTKKHGALLVFDEVMTGFRVHRQCAQGLFGITPDLTTLGKIIGGGLPLAAFGGRRDVMEKLSPIGDVYQAGTLSGNPLAVTAGLATLNKLLSSDHFDQIEARTKKLVDGINQLGKDFSGKSGRHLCAQSQGSMWGVYFLPKLPETYADISAMDTLFFNQFFHAMLSRGIYLAPSCFEAGFVSLAHSDKEIQHTLSCVQDALEQLCSA